MENSQTQMLSEDTHIIHTVKKSFMLDIYTFKYRYTLQIKMYKTEMFFLESIDIINAAI